MESLNKKQPVVVILITLCYMLFVVFDVSEALS